jgi:hypothetical protein
VAAFDLVARKLLWRRPVHTKGLLNMVAAPQLSEASTGVAQPTWHADAPLGDHFLEPGAVEVSDGTRMVRLLPAMPYKAWDPATGPPRQIPIENKRVAAATRANQLPAEVLGHNAYVPLRHVNIAPLVAELSARAREGLWDVDRAAASNAVLVGREDNMARYKPGVQTVHFIFSDNAATQCYFFPWWSAWKPHVLPVICEVLGWYGIPEGECEGRIVRLQLARMGPGGAILKHSDTGRWASGLHRIHVPLITNPEVRVWAPAAAARCPNMLSLMARSFSRCTSCSRRIRRATWWRSPWRRATCLRSTTWCPTRCAGGRLERRCPPLVSLT